MNKRICGLDVKKATTCSNIASIPLVYLTLGTGILFFNPNVVFLLRDPRYFDITDSTEQNKVNSNILSYSLIVSMCLTPLMGQLWEIIDRKVLVIVCAGSIALVMLVTPMTSPSIAGLTTCRVILNIMVNILHGSPLIPDYVKKESRGKAVVIQVMGYIVAEILAAAVLLNLTSSLDP
jgi:MFS family permease